MRTIWIEFHYWRGVGPDLLVFGKLYRCGIFSLGVAGAGLSDWVAAWHSKVGEAVKQ